MCHSEEFFKGFQILLWWCGSPHRVLTSCLLALASAAPERHPRLGGNQTLRRRQTRQAHNNNKKTCSHTKSEEVTVTHALEAGLTDVRPVRDDQPFLPVFQTCAPPPQIQVDTQQTEGGGGQLTPSDVNSLLPLRSFFAASSNRPGRWITTPLPGAGKNKSTKTGGVKA